MSKNQYIIADLGSSRISLLATELLRDGRVRVLSEETKELTGHIKYGIVKNPAKVAYTITELARLLQNSARIQEINKVCVSVNAKTMTSVPMSVPLKLDRNRVITDQTLDMIADECVKKLDDKKEVEVFDVIPLFYELNGKNIQNPIGLEGHRIEGFYNLVLGNASIKEELERSFERTRFIELEEYLPLGIDALATVLLSEEEKERGVALLNMGATTTTLASYKEGVLQKLLVVPLGAEHISKDIAELGISIANAERLKCLRGKALESMVEKPIRISIPNIDENEDDVLIDTAFLATIIEARLAEMMMPIFKLINDISFDIEEGIVLSGGGIKLDSIYEFLQENIDLPIRFGNHTDFLSPDTDDEFTDPIYAQSIGTAILLNEYYQQYRAKNKVQEQKKEKKKKEKKENKARSFSGKVANMVFKFFDDDNYLKS